MTTELPVGLVPTLVDARNDAPDVYATGCHADFEVEVVEPCVVHEGRAVSVALVGDSHAAQWVPALQSIARAEDWTLVSMTKSGCTPADVETYNGPLERAYTECTAWKQSLGAALTELDVDLIIVSGAGRYVGGVEGQLTTLEDLEAGLTRTLQTLDSIAPVLYLEDTPYPLEDVPACLSENPRVATRCVASSDASATPFRDVERRATEAANVPMVATNDMLCGAVACPVIVGEVLMYRDASHLTTVASKGLAQPLLDRLRAAGLPASF